MILFAGTFSPAYDFNLINKVKDKLQEFQVVRLTVATSLGSTDLWRGLNYDEVISVPHEEMPELIARHDIGVSVWKNDLGVCLTSVASTKTAEFLACGRPVIINQLQGDFGTMIGASRTGVVTSGGSEEEISRYAQEIINLLGERNSAARCRSISVNELSLELGVKALIQIYNRV